MLIINLYGQPSAGKSTVRADVFCRLKRAGIRCEEVYEFAKKLTYQKRQFSLSCQPYVFGKQLHELQVLNGQVDVVITDSPILLSRYYSIRHAAPYPQSFLDCVEDVAKTMDTMNFYLRRVHPYQSYGRQQTEAQSDEVGVELLVMLDELGVDYWTLDGDDQAGETIFNMVMAELANRKTALAA